MFGRSIKPRDRVAGGLLGVHAGDSLGATNEFASWERLNARGRLPGIVGGGPFRWKAGAATDDTDLTRAVLNAYTHPDGFNLKRCADNMDAWRRSGPPDIGTTTIRGLSEYARTGDPETCGATGSSANGSLMRCIPTGLFQPDRTKRLAESAAISRITHADSAPVQSCQAYNEMVHALAGGADPDDAVREGISVVTDQRVINAIRLGERLDLNEMASTGQGIEPGFGGTSCLDSLSYAVAAVKDPRSFEDTIGDVAHCGGDTDTNAAIAGGLVGTRDGVNGIPAEWRSQLEYRDEFEAAANKAPVAARYSPTTAPALGAAKPPAADVRSRACGRPTLDGSPCRNPSNGRGGCQVH